MHKMGVSYVNTLGITYIHGAIREHHYETIFYKIMGIPESEIDGVDGRCDIRFIFKVTTKKRYDDICSQFTGRDILIERGHTIRVDDISTPGAMIELTRVPFDLSNDHLKLLLSNYGKVNKCQSYFHRYGKYSNFNKSGHRIAWIDLEIHIPRVLHIKKTQNFINATYHEQPFSCDECGKTGHRARDCKTKPDDVINVLDTDLLLNKISGTGNNADLLDINYVDLDIHIGSSQSTDTFACEECDFKCSYEFILQEHMSTHTSEGLIACINDEVNKQEANKISKNTFKCVLCDIVSDSKSSYDAHLAIHDIDIQLSCSECEFECANEDVLNNHISSQHIYTCKVCKFTFTTAKHLTEHGKIHNLNKISCSECEYTCSSKADLKKHKKQHTGEKTEPNKRGLSISPEVNVVNKKAALRNNSVTKKDT